MSETIHDGTKQWRPIALVAAAVLLAGTLGCKDGDRKIVYTHHDSDDTFAKGANRPPTARTLYSLAGILAAQEKHDQARHVYIRITREYPEFMPAYCDLADLYMKMGEQQAAVQTLRTGLTVSPRDPVLLNDLGVVHLLMKDYRQAMRHFRQASSVSPQSERYRANMALATGMTGRYDESLALYEQVLDPAGAHYNVSVIAKARGDNETAEVHRQKYNALRKDKAPPADVKASETPAADETSPADEDRAAASADRPAPQPDGPAELVGSVDKSVVHPQPLKE